LHILGFEEKPIKRSTSLDEWMCEKGLTSLIIIIFFEEAELKAVERLSLTAFLIFRSGSGGLRAKAL
jgi:hypothetical protein